MEMLGEVISKVIVCLLSYDRKVGVDIPDLFRVDKAICSTNSKGHLGFHFD